MTSATLKKKPINSRMNSWRDKLPAYARARDFGKKDVITAYVENEEDVPFWKSIFQKYVPELEFRFEYNSKSDSSRGKAGLLRMLDNTATGDNLILCVDSDYDYLIGNQLINDDPFIFQTYAYAIENYKCAPKNLGLLCTEASACEETIEDFDFVIFMERYSEIVYPFFLYILHFKKTEHQQMLLNEHIITEPLIHEKELKNAFAIPPGEVHIENHGETILENLEARIQNVIQQLTEKHPDIDLKAIEEELQNKFNISPENICWFLHGHILYSNVQVLLEKVTLTISKKKIQKLEAHESNPDRLKQSKGEYANRKADVKQLLRTNHTKCLIYEDSTPYMKKIGQDLIHFRNVRKPLIT